MPILCLLCVDDFPSVVLYLDNKSKETSSHTIPYDNAPVFCFYELRLTSKSEKSQSFFVFFLQNVGNYITLHLQFHILVFLFSRSSFVFISVRNYWVGIKMSKLCC